MASSTSQSAPFLEKTKEGIVVRLHVVPGSSRTALAGRHGDRLKMTVRAPPREGSANRELIHFLGSIAGLPRRRVLLLRGAHSRRKDILLEGAELTVLGPLLGDPGP